MTKVLAVVGPTGSGKTALAAALAKKFNGVLISADSRQVYRGLNIGTNKEGVSGSWQGQPACLIEDTPQLMIDVINPGVHFTLNDWLEKARELLPKIWAAGQLPIVVGGTGLYVTALLEGYQPGGGRFAKNSTSVKFKSLTLQPEIERSTLYQRSDERITKIFDDLLAETKSLLNAGVRSDWLEKIGLDYRYALKSIKKELGREKVIQQFQQASRQYIRRQLTWWRHHGAVKAVQSAAQAEKLVASFLGS